MLCVPVCRFLVMDKNTKSVMACVPLITASPATTVEMPRKADEVEVGDETTLVVPRKVDEVDAKEEKTEDYPVETEDETTEDDLCKADERTVNDL